MTPHEPQPEGARDSLDRTRRGARWGAAGVFIVALIIVLALVLTLFGPIDRQEQAANWPHSSQSLPPPIP